MDDHLEIAACAPYPVDLKGFNHQATIPYGCTIQHIQHAMTDFVNFLGFINQQLHSRGLERLESMLMPANFSSMVGEFMVSGIPKYCPSLVKNRYHWQGQDWQILFLRVLCSPVCAHPGQPAPGSC